MAKREQAEDPLVAARPLAERVIAGEDAVFPQLLEVVWEPSLALIAASRSMRGLGAGEDEVREVASLVMTRLARDEHRALRLYGPWQADNPDKRFADWFKIVVSNVVRDFARAQRGSGGRGEPSEEPSVKRLLNQFAGTLPLDTLGARPPMTDAQTAKELLLFAGEQLPKEQLHALEQWLQGNSYEDIAEEQPARGGPSSDDVRRLVRAAVATLRRRFAEKK